MPSGEISATTVRQLLHPLGLSLCETLPLDSAEQMLRESGSGYVVITNMSDQPIGVITDRDIREVKLARPEKWASRRCACAVQVHPALQAGMVIDEVIELFSYQEIRPLLVREGHEVIGVLRPTEVFQWAAEHRPEALELLALYARRHETLPTPD
ncbi:CBS domain-containing protein [Nesterenkonia sp. E16_7]|uniref:CBS domain-containing protein n=1 Tax=unclassified Nesterenkonia TaxID=2629769 RepID=UPI001A925453|nr:MULTISPECIES: CBS domain-containing protein [unclassified Nesterenkonia]MBO0596282.1 CBS domain-containing protein [Nesterenkonia sp. E16_10]MBO0599983.1 CBS domain-containing protein [Nesterenkonia sp. E16_7]